ncbi:hypothetical protein PAPYR_57 [Paratrimastix pyriformis]|uniref:Uncharacterized protein n=1 Tax=Paratrimastix pyriformis TaxID=342808 RepID=A0ABQ8UYK2_9EUKA|nr:hypothetical protein PAPYR_57 [Paratrimastix pyriformis]
MVLSRNNVAKVPSLNALMVFGLPGKAPEPLRGQNLISAIDVLCGRGSDSITADQFHLMSVREDHEDVRMPREISFPTSSHRRTADATLSKF